MLLLNFIMLNCLFSTSDIDIDSAVEY